MIAASYHGIRGIQVETKSGHREILLYDWLLTDCFVFSDFLAVGLHSNAKNPLECISDINIIIWHVLEPQ